jgi:hypothetical protein
MMESRESLPRLECGREADHYEGNELAVEQRYGVLSSGSRPRPGSPFSVRTTAGRHAHETERCDAQAGVVVARSELRRQLRCTHSRRSSDNGNALIRHAIRCELRATIRVTRACDERQPQRRRVSEPPAYRILASDRRLYTRPWTDSEGRLLRVRRAYGLVAARRVSRFRIRRTRVPKPLQLGRSRI